MPETPYINISFEKNLLRCGFYYKNSDGEVNIPPPPLPPIISEDVDIT